MKGVSGVITPRRSIQCGRPSKKIIKKLLETYKDEFNKRSISIKEETILSVISKAKAGGRSAADFLESHPKRIEAVKATTSNANASGASHSSQSISEYIDSVIAEVYGAYEKTLRENNSLDFDDLLVYGVKLFAGHRKIGEWCKHVLVDEL